MLTAKIGYDALTVVYSYRRGFGVARFDKQAMPEPLCVGRVTGRFPRLNRQNTYKRLSYNYYIWQIRLNDALKSPATARNL